MKKPTKAYTSTLDVIRLGVLICFEMTKQGTPLVPVIWGRVGCGKSQLMQQIASYLGYELFDLRTSDKDPTDIGGTPVPNTDTKTLEYYVSNNLIPFKQYDEKGNYIKPKRKGAILFLDEKDRATIEVGNSCLQLDLDRTINGKELDDDVFVCGAGNADSDIGTTPLSSAAATRLIHFFVDTTSSKAVEGWQTWATQAGLPDWAIAFAEVRKEVFCGEEVEYTEVTECTPRTFEWAVRIQEKCEEIGKHAARKDVVKALVYGAIGQTAGQESMAFRKLKKNVPDIEAIISDPEGTPVPGIDSNGGDALGILYITKQFLIERAWNDGSEDREATRAFTTYASRWPEEIKAAFMRGAMKRGLTVAGLQEYKDWDASKAA
jgi:hypothetical protein